MPRMWDLLCRLCKVVRPRARVWWPLRWRTPSGFRLFLEIVPEVIIDDLEEHSPVVHVHDAPDRANDLATHKQLNRHVRRWKLKGSPFLAREQPKNGQFIWCESFEHLFEVLSYLGCSVMLR